MESADRVSDVGAACLALLVLRVALGRRGDALPTRYRAPEGDAPLSHAEAVEFLVALPKPLQYQGAIAGSAIRLDIDTDVDERRVAIRTSQLKSRTQFRFLREHYGTAIDALEVVCCGGAEQLRITVAEFQTWRRDYYLALPHSYGIDATDSSYARAQRAPGLDLRGAAAIAAFGFGDGVQVIVHSCS